MNWAQELVSSSFMLENEVDKKKEIKWRRSQMTNHSPKRKKRAAKPRTSSRWTMWGSERSNNPNSFITEHDDTRAHTLSFLSCLKRSSRHLSLLSTSAYISQDQRQHYYTQEVKPRRIITHRLHSSLSNESNSITTAAFYKCRSNQGSHIETPVSLNLNTDISEKHQDSYLAEELC